MNVKLEERFIGLMEILKAMDILGLVSGLVLFMFGMNVMGDALEKKAGGSLNSILAKLTSNRFKGFLLGAGVTAVIQSSSATTVMVVGFVNSGVMALRQAIGVIMGANVGTGYCLFRDLRAMRGTCRCLSLPRLPLYWR